MLRTRTAAPLLFGIWLLAVAAVAQSQPVVAPARHTIRELQIEAGLARVRVALPPERATGALLLIARGVDPLAVLAPSAIGTTFVDFTGPADQLQPFDTSATAWLIPAQLTRRKLVDWPEQADYFARILAVGPGGHTAWLRVGSEEGVQVGDAWWLRIHGQPAARLDTLYLSDRLALCRVQCLAADVLIEPDSAVALWPRLADRRDGAALSAVSFLEQQVDCRIAWIALPPNHDLHTGNQVEFSRQGDISGFGVIDRIDDLFGYVRITGEIAAKPAAADATNTAAAGSRPARGSAEKLAPGMVRVSPAAPISTPASAPTVVTPPSGVMIGDTARIRTAADLKAGRFVPRIVSLGDAGYLINAGEAEQLKKDFVGTVYRDGHAVGLARVVRVQTEYSLLRPVEDGTRFEPGDSFGNNVPPPMWSIAGRVERTAGRLGLRVARNAAGVLVAGQTYAVGRATPSLGVAIILEADYRNALAFVLPESCDAPIPIGTPLIAPADPAGRGGDGW